MAALSADQQLAMNLYQVILVALSLWIGVSQYILDRYEEIEMSEIGIMSSILAGFLTLHFALLQLGDFLVRTSSAGAISSAVNAVGIFVFILVVNLTWVLLRRSESYESTNRNFLKVGLVACLVYGISFLLSLYISYLT